LLAVLYATVLGTVVVVVVVVVAMVAAAVSLVVVVVVAAAFSLSNPSRTAQKLESEMADTSALGVGPSGPVCKQQIKYNKFIYICR